jgi:very-short-patch-repair endonuclease
MFVSELIVSRTQGIGYAKDAEKYLEAAMEGWTVLRLTEKQLEIEFIERIVAWINTLPAGADRSMTGRPR